MSLNEQCDVDPFSKAYCMCQFLIPLEDFWYYVYFRYDTIATTGENALCMPVISEYHSPTEVEVITQI